MSAQMNVPKLRFPEFSGEWEEKKIANVLKIGSGKDYKHLQSGDIPVFGTGGYMTSVNECLYDGESVCIGRKGTIDKPMYFNGKFWTVDTLFYTHSFNLSIPKFVYLVFQKINWKQYSEASGVPSLSKNTIENIEINLPKIPEQTKIATFLTAIDTKIDQLTKKQTLLKQYKKGVMQKLFSQELRFKADDGSEFPEWEEKTLGEIAEKQTRKNKDNSINHVFSNSAVQGIVNQRDYFDKDIANQNNLLNYYIIEKDDFIYNPRISNFAPVGPIGRNHLGLGVMSPLYSVFKIKQGNLDFFEQYFLTSNWYEYMESIANYGARADRMNITSSSFYLMPLPFPSLAEQTKIANFFASIDTKIDLATRQLEEAEQFKKALLQQMFV